MDISRNLILVEIGGIFRSLVDVGGNLTFMEFSGILGLVEFGGFLRRGVDISRNLRLVDLGGFSRFQFRVRAVGRKALLFITGGGK